MGAAMTALSLTVGEVGTAVEVDMIVELFGSMNLGSGCSVIIWE